jgi:hypothetical protein
VDGFEFQILKGMSKTLNRVDEIYIEMLSGKKKNKSYYKILKLLKKYDFHIKNKYSENYIFKKNN